MYFFPILVPKIPLLHKNSVADPHVFGLPDPDPLVKGMDPDPDRAPDPSIIKQK